MCRTGQNCFTMAEYGMAGDFKHDTSPLYRSLVTFLHSMYREHTTQCEENTCEERTHTQCGENISLNVQRTHHLMRRENTHSMWREHTTQCREKTHTQCREKTPLNVERKHTLNVERTHHSERKHTLNVERTHHSMYREHITQINT